MKERMLAALNRLDPRLLAGLAMLFVALLVFEGWVLLRQPLADYRTLRATRQALAVSLAAAAGEPDAGGLPAGQLDGELRQLAERLAGQLRASAPDDQLAAQLMAELDRSAGLNGVALASFRPGARRQHAYLEESGFELGAHGSYQGLSQWLLDFERTLGPGVAVSELTIKTNGEGKPLALTLKLGVFRPLPGSGEKK